MATATEERKRLTPAQKLRLCYSQGYLCATCKQLLPPTLQVDHKIPLHLGGTNDHTNLVALCPNCHADKTQIEAIDREERKKGGTGGAAVMTTSPYFPVTPVVISPKLPPPYVTRKNQTKRFWTCCGDGEAIGHEKK